jgi:hypothetical protein
MAVFLSAKPLLSGPPQVTKLDARVSALVGCIGLRP